MNISIKDKYIMNIYTFSFLSSTTSHNFKYLYVTLYIYI